jgi:hypothetical protein
MDIGVHYGEPAGIVADIEKAWLEDVLEEDAVDDESEDHCGGLLNDSDAYLIMGKPDRAPQLDDTYKTRKPQHRGSDTRISITEPQETYTQEESMMPRPCAIHYEASSPLVKPDCAADVQNKNQTSSAHQDCLNATDQDGPLLRLADHDTQHKAATERNGTLKKLDNNMCSPVAERAHFDRLEVEERGPISDKNNLITPPRD